MEQDQGAGDAGPGRRGATFSIARSIVVRGVAVIYLIAFASWWVQVDGLTGENGLVPLPSLMEMARDQLEPEERWLFPTVYWWADSNTTQHLVCAAGVCLAAAVLAGFLPGPGLLLLWILYLSIVVTGQAFMRFQWDSLLLESGLLAALWAPWPQWRLARNPLHDPRASLAVQWLFRALVFRLMFFSAAVKWASDDPLWRSFKALTVHYETQPLPTWTAYFMHWLPEPVHVVSCVLMFGLELAPSLLVFGPRLARTSAFTCIVALMAVVVATGNYTYFNYLTAVLACALLDDRQWRGVGRIVRAATTPIRARFHRPAREYVHLDPQNAAGNHSLAWLWNLPRLTLALVLGFGSLLSAWRQGLRLTDRPPLEHQAVLWWDRYAAPFYPVGSYGLFADMTETRPEIVLEGSVDGITWLPYEFRYKPGSLDRRPRFVAPHQPRLDWQMWFEALGAESGARPSAWFQSLVVALLQGRSEVLDLLEPGPWTKDRPRFVRARLYQYRFAEPPPGDWWERDFVREYVPGVSLRVEE